VIRSETDPVSKLCVCHFGGVITREGLHLNLTVRFKQSGAVAVGGTVHVPKHNLRFLHSRQT